MAMVELVDESKAALPFLKWAGGKRQLLPEIRKTMPASFFKERWTFKFGTYLEPFVGGGALFFELRALGFTGPAILGDSNAELMLCYREVAHNAGPLVARLRQLKYEEDFYYKVRAQKPAAMGAPAAAARTIYLNKAGYNGLYRVNRKGEFNAPFGRYTNPTICDEPNLRACAEALAGTQLITGDFEDIVSRAKRGDFVYFDPPYVPVSATADFTSYTKDGFGWKDQERLAACALRLKRSGVSVLLSNSDQPHVRRLYKGFEMRTVKARRNVNSKAGLRGHVNELLIW